MEGAIIYLGLATRSLRRCQPLSLCIVPLFKVLHYVSSLATVMVVKSFMKTLTRDVGSATGRGRRRSLSISVLPASPVHFACPHNENEDLGGLDSTAAGLKTSDMVLGTVVDVPTPAPSESAFGFCHGGASFRNAASQQKDDNQIQQSIERQTSYGKGAAPGSSWLRSMPRSRESREHLRRQKPLKVFVMLPLDTVNCEGVFKYSLAQWFLQSLQLLAATGVHGVAVDVWWGAVERQPGCYNWTGYKQLFEMLKTVGLKAQAVMSFHGCGGNVGDVAQIPLPEWVLQAGQQDPDLFYTDRPRDGSSGHRNREYISLFADDAPGVLAGRSPMQCYEEFMIAFRDVFEPYIGTLIEEVVVGAGPCGELRYPSYVEGNGWRFPGIGEFQCYDRRALASLAQAARAAGHPEWGYSGPHNAGHYNSLPEETGFFSDYGSWDSPYGDFFLSWYSGCLLQHAERLLMLAKQVFKPIQQTGERAPFTPPPQGKRLLTGLTRHALDGMLFRSPSVDTGVCTPYHLPSLSPPTRKPSISSSHMDTSSSMLSEVDETTVDFAYRMKSLNRCSYNSTMGSQSITSEGGLMSGEDLELDTSDTDSPPPLDRYALARQRLGSCGLLEGADTPHPSSARMWHSNSTSSIGSDQQMMNVPSGDGSAALSRVDSDNMRRGSTTAMNEPLSRCASMGPGLCLAPPAGRGMATEENESKKEVILTLKLAGIHWWYRTSSHAAELTAGYYNTSKRDGYRDIVQLCARYGFQLTLTCVEMCDAQHPQVAMCGPEGLLRQVRTSAMKLNVLLSGENALPIFLVEGVDNVALQRIVANTGTWLGYPPPGLGDQPPYLLGTQGNIVSTAGRSFSDAGRLVNLLSDPPGRSSCLPSSRSEPDLKLVLPAMASFTFLRLGPEFLQSHYHHPWLQFMYKIQAGGMGQM